MFESFLHGDFHKITRQIIAHAKIVFEIYRIFRSSSLEFLTPLRITAYPFGSPSWISSSEAVLSGLLIVKFMLHFASRLRQYFTVQRNYYTRQIMHTPIHTPIHTHIHTHTWEGAEHNDSRILKLL